MIFVFDENYSPQIVEGFTILESGNRTSPSGITELWHILKLANHLEIEKEDPNAAYSDAEVIKIAGKRQGIIITEDTDFKRVKHYHKLYDQYKIGAVIIKSHRDIRGYWDRVIFLSRWWEELKTNVKDSKPPFCLILDKRGISPCPF